MSLAGKEQGFMRTVLSHRLFKNTSALVVLQLFNYLAPLIVLIHLTRVLGIELYGVVAFSMGMIQFSFVIMDFGFSLSATKKISQHRERQKYIARLLGSILAIKFFLFLLIAGVIVLYIFKSTRYTDYRLLFLLTLLPILGQGYQPTWFFSGLERMSFVAAAGVVSRVVFVIFVLLFVRGPEGYLLVPIGNGIAQLTATVLSFVVVSKLGFRIKIPTLADLKYTLKMTAGYFVSRLSVSAYMNSGVLVMGVFSAPAATAVYSLAEQLYRVMQSAFLPINQSLFPFMVRERRFDLWVKLTLICLFIALAGSILGYYLSPILIPLVFGLGWDAVLSVLQIFFIAILVHVAAVFFGYPLGAIVNKLDVPNRSVVYGAFVYLLGVAAFIALDKISALMLAALMVVAEFIVFLNRAISLIPLAKSKGLMGSAR